MTAGWAVKLLGLGLILMAGSGVGLASRGDYAFGMGAVFGLALALFGHHIARAPPLSSVALETDPEAKT